MLVAKAWGQPSPSGPGGISRPPCPITPQLDRAQLDPAFPPSQPWEQTPGPEAPCTPSTLPVHFPQSVGHTGGLSMWGRERSQRISLRAQEGTTFP